MSRPGLRYLTRTIPFLLFLVGVLLVIPSAPVSAYAMNMGPLSSGETHLIGQVNVLDLPSVSQDVQTQVAGTNSLHAVNERAFQQENMQMSSPAFVPSGESTKLTVSSSGDVARNTSSGVSAGLTLEGAPGGSPNPCACSPPDPNLGVGPNHIFEMVNQAGIIYDKTGTLVKDTFSLSTFFNLPSSSMSDPQVFYDANSGRWFASIVDIPNGRVQFAVSTTSDPTGAFNLYSVATANRLPDQPFIGSSDDKFVISANDFNSAGTTYIGVQYWVLNKSELVSGASTIHFATNTPDPNMFSLRPARHLTSTLIFYLVTNCFGSCISDPQSTTSSARLVAVSGAPPGAITVTTQTFSISTSTQPPNAEQAGTTTLLTTNDNRILSAVWESNTLWFTGADACTPSGDSTTRSCLRLVELTTSGTGAPSKVEDFDYSSKGEYLYYPALSLSQGQLAVVYGRSSSSTDPSILVTGRIPPDPANTLEAPLLVRSGAVPDTSTRYGDYFGAATDPAPSSRSTFWVAGEYRKSLQSASWNTAIVQIGSLAPPVPVSVSSSLIFQGINVTTTGNLFVNPANSTFSGAATVTATNATGGATLVRKSYSISGSSLRVEGSFVYALFLLNVPVAPYSLSVNLDITVRNGTGTSSVSLSRQIDISSRGRVDIVDAATLAAAFDSTPSSQNWNPQADLEARGRVDIIDAASLAFFFDAPNFT